MPDIPFLMAWGCAIITIPLLAFLRLAGLDTPTGPKTFYKHCFYQAILLITMLYVSSYFGPLTPGTIFYTSLFFLLETTFRIIRKLTK